MPAFKKGLGNKPPKINVLRPGATQYYASFDPFTLERDYPTGFHAPDQAAAERWLIDRWNRASQAARAELEGRALTMPLAEVIEIAKGRALKLSGKPLSVATLSAYDEALDILSDWLAHRHPELSPFRIEHITPDLVLQYIDERSSLPLKDNRKAPGRVTLYKHVCALRWALGTGAPLAQIQGKLELLKPAGLKGQSTPRSVYLSMDQIGRYLAAMEEPALRAFCMAFAVLGCRRGDAFRLRKDSFVQDEEGHWSVRIIGASKQRDRRALVLPSAMDLAKEHILPHLPIKLTWLTSADSVYYNMRAAARKAGVPYASPNDLRASFCTILVSMGEPKELVAAVMGTSIAMIDKHYFRAHGIDSEYERQKILAGAGKGARGSFSEVSLKTGS